MGNKARSASPFHLASVPMASWVALWLAFILATHAFWCGLESPSCNDVPLSNKGTASLVARTMGTLTSGASALQSTTQHTLYHTHPLFDVCSGTDETRSLWGAARVFVAPLVIWVALLFATFTVVLVSLYQQAAIFGRDGPVCVPPLHSCLVRSSLPHRAPPVFLN